MSAASTPSSSTRVRPLALLDWLTRTERSVEWCRQQESTFVTESTWWGEANGSAAPMDIAA